MSTSLTPNLMSEDVNASVIFYRDNLGFDFLTGLRADGDGLKDMVKSFAEEVPLQWAMLGRGDAKLMFQSRRSLSEECEVMNDLPLAVSGALYLEVDELDRLLGALGSEVETVLPDHITYYGMREVWIRDNSGYILVLAQKAA